MAAPSTGRPPRCAPDVIGAVDAIVADVRARGDAALLEYTARFDGFGAAAAAGARHRARGDFEAAERALEPAVRAALAYAAERIERYHAAALPKSWRMTDEHGSVLGQDVRPLDRVGIYIPGGRAAYPSTVLMTAVPARVAGVREIVLVTPPGRDGSRAAGRAGRRADRRRHRGLAHRRRAGDRRAGVRHRRPSDASTRSSGPATSTSRSPRPRVFGDVGIDMVAGPSEVVVVADRARRSRAGSPPTCSPRPSTTRWRARC